MAVLRVVVENFRGKDSAEYHFVPGVNTVAGRNGAGKSSIKEAITFALTGADSHGARNPQHLISHGKPGLKVTLTTDKSEITRTLSNKGNGTIRLTKGSNTFTLNQSELEKQLGSADLFLSAFLPGFFLNLPTERQHKVIAEITPPTDRKALFTEIAGFEMTAQEQLQFSLSRRCDLVASDIAVVRRDLEKQAAHCLGELKVLESVKPLPRPEPSLDAAFCAAQEALKEHWAKYRLAIGSYNTTVSRITRIQSENASKESRRQEIQQQLSTLQVPPMAGEKDPYPKLERELKDTLQLEPPMPRVLDLNEEPICSSCGQTVGVKHRERVKKQNEKLLEEYRAQCVKVRAHNQSVEEQLLKLRAEFEEHARLRIAAQKDRESVLAARHALEVELASLTDAELPGLPGKPLPPSEVFREEDYLKARASLEAHKTALVRWQYAQEQMESAQARLAPLRADYEAIQKRIDRLQAMEAAVKAIPQRELAAQKALFDFPEYTVLLADRVEVFQNDVAYPFLSEGEKMKVGVAFCQRINQHMPRPTNILFMDNCDLVDTPPKTGMQTFLAKVDPACTVLTIKEAT